jgi:large repetitive protein
VQQPAPPRGTPSTSAPASAGWWAASALLALLSGVLLALLAGTPSAHAATGPVFHASPAVQDTRALSWSGTIPDGATVSCVVSGPGVSDSVDCATAGGFAVSYTAPSDGSWTLTVTTTTPTVDGDVTGSDSRTTVVDTEDPVVTAQRPASPSADRDPVWTVSITGASSGTCTVTGPGLSTSGSCTTSFTTTLPAAPGGEYVLTVTATDAAGNSASATADPYVLLVPPPSAGVTAAPSPSKDTSPPWTFTTHGATATCRLTGPATDLTVVDCTSPFVRTLTGGDGRYRLVVELTGPGGTSSSDATYDLDTTAPDRPAVAGSSGRTNAPSLSWSFPATDDAECTVERNGVPGAPGACRGTYTASPTSDGDYVLVVVLVDTAGNRSLPGTSLVTTVDRTAPAAAVITSAPPSLSNGGPSRSFTWNTTTAPSPDVTECRLTGPGRSDTWSLCSGTFSVSTVGLADGHYLFEVRTRDDLFNASTPAAAAVTLDASPPFAPTASGPSGPSSSRTVPVVWSGDSTATGHCSVVLGGVVLRTVVDCPRTWSADLTGLADDTYDLQVVLVDAAGNRSEPATVRYTLDTTPPPVPSFTSTPAPTAQRAPSWSFTAIGATGYTCRLLDAGRAVLADVRCDSGSYTADLTGRPDGPYELEVRADDGLGNLSDVLVGRHVLDTRAPLAPTLSGPTGPSNVRSWPVTWDGEAGAVASCRLLHEGTLVTTLAECPRNTTVSLVGRPDGTWTLVVTLTDASGNTSLPASLSYVLDTTPPALPVFTSEPGTSSTRTPTWEFASDGLAGTDLYCRLTGPGRTYLNGLCSSPLTQNLTGQPDGSYVLVVWARDAVGNLTAEVTSTYLLDTVPPAAPSVVAAPALTSGRTPTWQLSGPGDAVLVCRLVGPDGTVVHDGTCATTFSPGPLTGPDGAYVLTVRSRDAAGNLSPAVTSTYVLDTAAPAVPTFTRVPATSSDRAPWWSFTAETGARLTCRLLDAAGAVLDAADCSSGRYDAALPGPDGTYRLEVTATDAAGNTSGPASSAYVLDTLPPAAPTLVAPVGPTHVRTWTVRWSGEAGTTARCVLTLGTTVLATDSACAPVRDWLLSGVDGTYTVTVDLLDAAGNRSEASSTSVLLDTTPPAAAVFTVEPATSSTRTPSWGVTSAEGTLVCRLTGPDGAVLLDADCASPVVGQLEGQPDGLFTLVVVVRDAAGNLSAERTSTYLLDTRAPLVPRILTGPPPTGSTRSVSWTSTSDDGEALECLLVGPDGAIGSWTSCASGSFSTTLTGADGPYALHVRARDAAQNLSAEATWGYLLDTTPPPPVGVVAPRSPWNSRTPSWQFTPEPGAHLECRVQGGSWTACSTPFALDLAGAPDGAYVVEVRAVDAAGNTGPGVATTYVLDTTPPASPVFTQVPPTSFVRTPTWRWDVPADAVSATCRLTGPLGLLALGPCGPSFTTDLTGQPDGSYLLEVLVTDAAGNDSAAVGAAFVLDTVAPDAPVLQAPSTPGNDRTPTWSISGEGAASCRVLRDGVEVQGWTACGPTFTADLTAAPDTDHVVEVRLTDVAGNTSASTASLYRLDTVAPPAPFVGAPAGSPSNQPSATWTLTSSEGGALTSCRVLRGTTVVRDWVACTASPTGSPYLVDLVGLPDGTYVLEARHTDAAGNTGATASAPFVRDTTPPAPVAIAAPVSPGSSRSPSWSFTTEPGAVLSCRAGDLGPYTACEAGGTLALDLTSAPDGTYAVWVFATDVAGNVGTASRSIYVLDTTRPDPPRLTPPVGPSSNRTPAWTWTGEPGAVGDCQLRRDGVLVLQSTCLAPWSPVLEGDGTWTLVLRLVDAAGNLSQPVEGSYVLDTRPPVPPVVAGPSSPNSLARPVFTFTGEEGALFQCRLVRVDIDGTTSPADWVACTSPFTPTLTQTGDYLLEVRAVDAAGNASGTLPYAYEYDPASPAGLLDLQVPPSPGNDPRPTWTFVAPPGTTTTCRLATDPDGAVVVETACAGTFQPTLPADGTYRVTITVVDAVGNVGRYTAVHRLDTTGPGAPRAAPVDAVGTTPSVDWTWTGDAEAVWECRLTRDGAEVAGWSRCATGLRSDLSALGDGLYRLQVRGRDALGNLGPQGLGSYLLDRTPPSLTSLTAVIGTAGPARLVPWTFPLPTDAVAARCSVVRDGRTVRQAVSCTGGSFTMDLTGMPEGRYDLVLELFDRADNRTVQSAAYVLSSTVVRGPVTLPPTRTGEDEEPPVRSAPLLGRPAPAVDALPLPAALAARPVAVEDQFPSATQGAAAPGEAPAAGNAPVVESAEPVLGLPGGPISGARAVEALKDVAGETIRRPTLPLALLLVVALFLAVQNRIDRRDPKLAMASVEEEPLLDFRPRGRSGPTTGGALA